MAEIGSVPVVCIDRTNVKQTWPSLKLAISTASFIGIDTELSGLGNRASLLNSSIEDRYASAQSAASTRSVISIGISCFKLRETKDENSHSNYLAQTFNILTLCEEEYIVEPDSLRFLIDHGFDFNKQYSVGLLYHRGNDKPECKTCWGPRDLFTLMLSSKKPIVLHNGFIDMVFLYHNFYANSPKKFTSFIADLESMFPSGIFDTKYIAEYHARTSASFLEYIFRKSEKENSESSSKKKIHLHFLNYESFKNDVEYRRCGNNSTEKNPICLKYASYGWCEKGSECLNSHDVSQILQAEENKKKGKKRKRKDEPIPENEETMDSLNSKGKNSEKCGHRAGFDAFMTAFSFAHYISRLKDLTEVNFDFNKLKEHEYSNKLYLVKKDFPLQIYKSNFAKPSQEHIRKICEIQNSVPI